MADLKKFTIENANIIWRNFAGEEGQYNRKGDRNFSIVLDEPFAQQLLADGWNVRVKDPTEEGDEPFYTIPVAVSFKNRPPRVVMLTSVSRTTLDESSVEVLDYAEIKTVDLICRGYDWEVNGKTGTKAYLQTLFATIEEDELEKKYGYYEDRGEAVQPGDDANE